MSCREYDSRNRRCYVTENKVTHNSICKYGFEKFSVNDGLGDSGKSDCLDFLCMMAAITTM